MVPQAAAGAVEDEDDGRRGFDSVFAGEDDDDSDFESDLEVDFSVDDLSPDVSELVDESDLAALRESVR